MWLHRPVAKSLNACCTCSAIEFPFVSVSKNESNFEASNVTPISSLEELGVQNAAEIVADELTAKTEELIVAKEYLAQTGTELASATDNEVNAFILEQIEAGKCLRDIRIHTFYIHPDILCGL